MTKKIAFLNNNLDGGGEERIFTISANSLVDQGYQIDIVLCRARGVFLEKLSPEINVVNLSVQPRISALEIFKYIRHNQPDLIISTTDTLNWSAIIATILSRTSTKVIARIPTTISMQIKTTYKKILLRIISTIIYPFADHIITVSYESEKDFLQFTHVRQDLVTTIYNPVIIPDVNKLAHRPPKHEWFDDGNPPVILGVGRLHHQKNFPNLIRAFKLVLEHQEARLLILGEGSERGNLEKLIGDLNLNAYVSMPGFELNPYTFMKNAAVFVLPSDVEGLPTVLIEALACGCQTVSTQCPSGPSEILEGGKHGYLVPVNNPQALAQSIVTVLDGERKPDNLDHLERFNAETVMKKHEKLISDLL